MSTLATGIEYTEFLSFNPVKIRNHVIVGSGVCVCICKCVRLISNKNIRRIDDNDDDDSFERETFVKAIRFDLQRSHVACYHRIVSNRQLGSFIQIAATRQRVILERTSLRFDSNRSSPYHKTNVVNNESPSLLSALLSYIFFLNIRRITASASLHARFLLSDSTVWRKYVYLLYSSSFFLFFLFFFFFFPPRSSCVSPSSRETMVYIFVFSYFLSLSPRGSFTAYIPVMEVDRMSQKGNVIKRTDLDDDDDDDNDKKATTSSSIFLFPFFFLPSLLAFVFIPRKENPSTIS